MQKSVRAMNKYQQIFFFFSTYYHQTLIIIIIIWVRKYNLWGIDKIN